MSSLPLRIRSFQPVDLNELYRIDQVCFPAEIAFSRVEFIYYLGNPKSMVWIAEESGTMAGFVMACAEKRFAAHVLTLDVLPEYRKRQIGTALMDKLHGELGKKRILKSVLEVGVQNVAAQRLYEKLHYHYTETLIGYYRGLEDAFRMIRSPHRPVKSPSQRSHGG